MPAEIRRSAAARAGLAGNPSDGYHGKTLSVAVQNFQAEVVLAEADRIEILPGPEDEPRFGSIADLADHVRHHGYYGGRRLVVATLKRFAEYCQTRRVPLDDRAFSLRHTSTIPRHVGLGGSSAIVVATLRCLMAHYGVEIPLEVQPSLALAVETDELGIPAGLQDRVAQVYEGLVFMDFDEARQKTLHGRACFAYERLDACRLPLLYLAYGESESEPSEVFHGELRARFDRGDPDVRLGMRRLAEIAAEARAALLDGKPLRLARLMNENFDTRRRLCRLPRGHVHMVEVARECGASAKFAGSGGAIVGTYEGDTMFETLVRELAAIGCRTIKVDVGAS